MRTTHQNEPRAPIHHDTTPPVFMEANFDTLSMSFAERDAIRAHIPGDVAITLSETGIPNLSTRGRLVYDPIDPVAGAKRQVDLIEADDETTLVVLMGLGLGYHAEHLERRFTCPILVYEPDLDILATTLAQRPLPLRRTIVCTEISALLVQTQSRLLFSDRRLVIAAILEYQLLFNDAFEKFKETMSQAVSNAQILESTTTIRTSDWIYHAAANLPKAADKCTVECLGERLKGTPGILVSAGPSLDGNIDALKAAVGHAVIISVNAAARPLEAAGIKPDIVAVVEGLDLRAQLQDISWLKEVVLAPTLNCFPGFFDLQTRHIFPIADFSVSVSDWFSKAFGWRQMSSGGSVACTAFSILVSLGCDPIILVGQDLAYTRGQSYAKAATFGAQTMRFDPVSGRLRAVEAERNTTIESIRTKGGLALLDNLEAAEIEGWGKQEKVYSVAIFNLFRTWFETAANTWAKERTLINATEGGAHIEGFEEIPLKEAISTYCAAPLDTDRIIAEAVESAPPNDLGALTDVIEADLEILEQLSSLSEEAKAEATTAIRILETGGIGEADPSLRRLGALETGIRTLSRKNRTIDTFISGKVHRLRVTRFEDRDDNTIRQSQNALRRAISLFDVIQDGAKELLALFRPVVAEITHKMESP